MSRRQAALILSALCLALAALLPTTAAAAPAPAWGLTVTPMPANFSPSSAHQPEYMVIATNLGGAPTKSETTTIEATLPTGLVPSAVNPSACTTVAQLVKCETTEPLAPGELLLVQVTVEVLAPEGTLDMKAAVRGGGAPEATTTFPTQIQAAPLGFGFLPGFKAPLTNDDGTPTTLAGSHPYQQTVDFAFPTENPSDGITNSGHPRNFYVELPRGMIGNPAASPVLCTEAQLTSKEGCPDASQVGLTDVTTLVGEVGNNTVFTSNLYNMVPPPGTAAEFATNVAGVGIYAHIQGSVRSDDDYGIQAATHDVLALGTQPIFGAQAQIWGDPSAKAHDQVRGKCSQTTNSCPVPARETALLSTPGDCPGPPPLFEMHADSWEEPSPEFEEKRTFYESADLAGAPAAIKGCGELAFEPSIEARPTTSVTDSPSGFDFILHQPSETKLDSRSPASLRDAAVHFPAGLAVNAAQAGGLGACSEGQVGFEGEEEGTLFFSKAPQGCPAAAKIGTVTVTSPLLVARNEDHEVEENEGEPVLEALHGAVYLAKPFANPFGSLVAAYIAVEDPKTGIVAKLAGEGELDPRTGQLSTYFEENPELPFKDISVHLFGGARGAFVTPPTCGTFTTQTELTPWSAPEGQDALPQASFATATAPSGGPCPASEAQMPNAFKLSAGTQSPSAGKYSPLLFKLSREDGTQRLSKVETTLPTGLIAKLAGVGTCSEAAIAKARSREVPNQGALEQADPSCPAGSEIGVVNAGAGAGPTPYYTQGHAYLAGPYKGAPVSMVAIVPAVAGPFDLGTVVSRIALYIDPTTTQVRVVSDPLPTILDGVPVDLRSIAVRASRPGFSLNPTSCDVKSFDGAATSTLGQITPLAQRFQVGGCKSLPYKPKLHLRLFGPIHRGGHPRFRAVFEAKPGEANTARASLTLPRSEFIDQAHFRTICTRVQYAANQCPAGSIYGQVKAITPLLDYPIEGPVYLRSSSHELPDVVAALRGPPSQPIAFDLVGRVDSVNGGLRTRIETLPDAPVSKAIITLQGAKKGLFQNSTNICKGTFRANLKLDGQNGKAYDTQPVVKADCKGKGGKKGKGAKGGGHKRR